MDFLNKLERKFGRFAISNLPAVMIGLYAAGYVLSVIAPTVFQYLYLEPYYILRGQIWRIITWVIIPPGRLDVFTVIMLFFYFSIGRTLERTWGTFRFNVYIFMGIIFTVIGAFIVYAIQAGSGTIYSVGGYFSTYWINMSIFLAIAFTYPDMQVLLYFVIPVKVKWLGVLDGVLIAYEFFQTGLPGKVAILASLLNFFLFFLLTHNLQRMAPKEVRRRQTYKKAVKSSVHHKGTIHRCAVCGRTEADGDHLVFRYCSKCDGAYEYCQDHLFNHEHRHQG